MNEERRLENLIKQDNVEEISNILNSNENLRKRFNNIFLEKRLYYLRSYYDEIMPLLHTAVEEKSQKVVEYLLSQDFVDKTICSARGNNIYHVLCRIRGAEELFSIIERKVPHHLLLNYSRNGINAFHIACEENNVIIVKRVYEILESLQLDITKITKSAMNWAMRNKDVEVIKYVLSIRGVQLTVNSLSRAIRHSTFDIVVYLLNVYLCDINNSENNRKFKKFNKYKGIWWK